MRGETRPAAIITGAGRGIGRAAALALSRRSYDVVLVSRTEDELLDTALRTTTANEQVVADVADPVALRQIIDRALFRFGRIDALVHCAGIAPMRPIEKTDFAIFNKVIAVNLTAAFALAQLAWPHLKKQGGTIVNVSSLAAVDPFAGSSAYAAAKAGLEGLTRALAKDGAEHGIRAVAVAPGGVETAMFRALPRKARVPSKSLLSPDDVASVIAGCITSPLRYASGETIRLRK